MVARIEYPHWLMLAGAVLVLVGLVGWAFQRTLQAQRSYKPKDSVRESAVPKPDEPAVEPAASAKLPRGPNSMPGNPSAGRA
jgi:hypothetical protein